MKQRTRINYTPEQKASKVSLYMTSQQCSAEITLLSTRS